MTTYSLFAFTCSADDDKQVTSRPSPYYPAVGTFILRALLFLKQKLLSAWLEAGFSTGATVPLKIFLSPSFFRHLEKFALRFCSDELEAGFSTQATVPPDLEKFVARENFTSPRFSRHLEKFSHTKFTSGKLQFTSRKLQFTS